MEANEVLQFEAVVLPHLDAAYTLARYLTRDPHDAEDLVQEACLRALRYFEGFRGGDGRNWFLTIVRNTCYSWRKRRQGEALGDEFDEERHRAEDPVEDPEARLIREADGEAVRRAVDGLPPEYREMIVLRELQGLSYRAIAEVAGVPEGTVMSRLSRARQRLARAVASGRKGEG